jgi:hypothetical protein
MAHVSRSDKHVPNAHFTCHLRSRSPCESAVHRGGKGVARPNGDAGRDGVGSTRPPISCDIAAAADVGTDAAAGTGPAFRCSLNWSIERSSFPRIDLA